MCIALAYVRFTPESDIKCVKVECPLRAIRRNRNLRMAKAELLSPSAISKRCHAIVALHDSRQPNVLIQLAMARPISSGESSWT